MIEQAVAYALQRKQFDRVIGSFQAVKHMCAEMVAELEPALEPFVRADGKTHGNPGGYTLTKLYNLGKLDRVKRPNRVPNFRGTVPKSGECFHYFLPAEGAPPGAGAPSQSEGQQELSLPALQLGCRFYVETLAHAKDKSTLRLGRPAPRRPAG